MPIVLENNRLCVDFIATEFGPAHFPVDLLSSARYLTEWISRAGVVDDARPLDRTHLYRAIAVRSLIAGTLRAAQQGHVAGPREARARYRLSELAGQQRPRVQLRGERLIRRGGFEAFLAELATDGLELLARPQDLRRVRWCADIRCRRAFFDHSAAGRRRWCAKVCRDQASSSRYRLRRFGLAS